jgi:hypothetical protein
LIFQIWTERILSKIQHSKRINKMAETPRKGTPTGYEEPLTVVKIDEKASSQSLGPRDPASQDSECEESPYTILRNEEKIFTIIQAIQ